VHLPVPRLIRLPEHVPQVSVHDFATEARRLSYLTVTLEGKRKAMAVTHSALAPIYDDGDAVLSLSSFFRR
jgi:hypothetical protein